MAISYKDSGVDVTRGYKAVDLMKKYVKTTYNAVSYTHLTLPTIA